MSSLLSTLGTWHMKVLGKKTASGSGTLTGFYSDTPGDQTVLEVVHDEVGDGVDVAQDFSGGTFSPPVFLDDDGAYLPGCHVFYDCSDSDGKKFRVIFERATDSSYEPLTGDLEYTWSRVGRKW